MIEELPDFAVAVLRAAGVAVAWVYGSRARGDPRPGSDLDLAVLLRAADDGLGLLEKETLAAELAGILAVPDVDLVLLDRAPLELRARVVQDGRLVLRDDEVRRVRFEVDTQSRWFDVAPAHAEQTRRYLEGVAERGLRGR